MTEPARLHPLTLVFEALRVGRALILPSLVGAFSTGGADVPHLVRWGIGILVVPALITSGARYLSFRYRLLPDGIVIDAGVLRRSRRVIPVSRVQHIDVRQSALQRLGGVAELRVETAGGGETEAVLSVLGLAEAERVRAELLARRAGVVEGAPIAPSEEPPPLARLGTRDLALAGATANEIGVVAALIGGLLNLGGQLGIRVPRPQVDPGTLLPASPALTLALVVGVLALVVLILGWGVSVVGTVVRYHGFTLGRAGDELRKRYGLLTRHEEFVPLRRVQTVRIQESLLRRRLGLAALTLETAGGLPGKRSGAEPLLPLARRGEVAPLVRAVFPALDVDALRFHPVHPRARIRALVRYSLPLLALAAGLALLRDVRWLGLLALLPAAAAAAHLHFRHLGYALAPGFVVARAGFLNQVSAVLPLAKIQTLHLRQTPVQRRHRLATLVLETAAGRVLVPDLHRDDAAALLDRLAAEAAPLHPRVAATAVPSA